MTRNQDQESVTQRRSATNLAFGIGPRPNKPWVIWVQAAKYKNGQVSRLCPRFLSPLPSLEPDGPGHDRQHFVQLTRNLKPVDISSFTALYLVGASQLGATSPINGKSNIEGSNCCNAKCKHETLLRIQPPTDTGIDGLKQLSAPITDCPNIDVSHRELSDRNRGLPDRYRDSGAVMIHSLRGLYDYNHVRTSYGFWVKPDIGNTVATEQGPGAS